MDAVAKLNSLTVDELAGVINLYPWFGAARRELCERMARMGGSEWGKEQYADAAMYISSRNIVSDIVRSTRNQDYSDKDVEALLKEYIAPVVRQGSPTDEAPVVRQAHQPVPAYRRTVNVVGGDFFSSEQYDQVQEDGDNYFSRFKARKSEEKDDRKWDDPELGFCTETLAWIYADQGYYTEAKKIYSRLILRYPEKSAYFASLIEKLDKEN